MVAVVLTLPAGAHPHLCRHPPRRAAPRRGAAARCRAHRSRRQPRGGADPYFQSLHWLDSGIAELLFYTFPVVTLDVERFFLKQQVAPAALLCVVVIFAGAALIAVPGLRDGRSTRAALPGQLPARSSTPSMPGCWRGTHR